ncbi:MAG TPA: phenylalanine--tRNA ligase subunit beta [Polyangiaceae bacterium]|jgi:phenylalanyl-tRNA synthetase beta chain|nr:MAG: Phenylalanine--tRNA ligase beta subunit [Deltaproteobacteria bacterium ADurb.Bin207]HNS95862.1 phenylalanine--tRNA ligase subunit beta [Polyangiaceae bacterium]HNZ21501.1 phenylalanine--tRNA ligase subunit beta [Polyangiaceae bacterium]HOD25397.1 phenylalanine--tRNA ligase subunit beta [Polyangiaceae bacterium]HOE51371.1 phenylalanine--tRNA ligase subunit beta [Polyangiaceae bacterium]
MPIVNIDASWLNELLEKPYPPQQLIDALDQIGCDVEEVVELPRYRCPQCQALVEGSLGADTVKQCSLCGFTQMQPFEIVDTITAIRLDLLAARPDLFDIGGLVRALQGYLGEKKGLPSFTSTRSDIIVNVDPSVCQPNSYRPFLRCAVIELPSVDDRMLVALMKLQENLHWGVGRDRKLASIGIYDLDTIKGPITYKTLHPDDEPFVPLGVSEPMSGRKILSEHSKGIAYAHLLANHDRYPVLVDADGHVLSMPPIINSERTKIKIGSHRLFVDVTGISIAAVENTLHTLVSSLVELGATIRTVRIVQDEKELETPDLTPKQAIVDLSQAKQWLGLPLDAHTLMESLFRMRLDVEPIDESKTRFRVRYPAFRSDIRHTVDVFEDVAIGFGFQNIQAKLVPTMTVGSSRTEEQTSDLARTILLGLGYSEIMSLPMTTESDHYERFRMPVPNRYPRVGNPKLKALTVVRQHLMSGVMQALHDNRRRPMPQRLFEIDNVALLDDEAPTGCREERRVCFVEMGKDAGYATARSILDAMLREMGVEAAYSATQQPWFTAGRAARFQAGSFEGILGELHPEVILAFGLDHPVALVEVTLGSLRSWPIPHPRTTERSS